LNEQDEQTTKIVLKNNRQYCLQQSNEKRNKTKQKINKYMCTFRKKREKKRKRKCII